MTTVGEIKIKVTTELNQHNVSDFQFEAISLIGHILGIKQTQVIVENQIELTNKQENDIKILLNKRIKGNPLAYLINEKFFYNEKFFVNENVLIPRQETEELIDYFFLTNKHESMQNKNILDIGTGSGIISIICKKKYPQSNVFSIDKSNKAICVAKKNALEKNLSIEFKIADIKDCKIDKIDYVISNPPYIKTNTIKKLQKEVLNEPEMALDGGVEGISIIHKIFEWEKNINKNNAMKIILEIDKNIKEEVKRLAMLYYPNKNIEIIDDIAKKPRILYIS